MEKTLYQVLSEVRNRLPSLIDETDAWDSLIVDLRKPVTYRLFRTSEEFPGIRICLHKFEPCTETESFFHPHPWPGAFEILQGRYDMYMGTAPDYVNSPGHLELFTLTTGSRYTITDPRTFHSVIPIVTTYTLMVNDIPWEKKHRDSVSTIGKDLAKFTSQELKLVLEDFKFIVTK